MYLSNPQSHTCSGARLLQYYTTVVAADQNVTCLLWFSAVDSLSWMATNLCRVSFLRRVPRRQTSMAALTGNELVMGERATAWGLGAGGGGAYTRCEMMRFIDICPRILTSVRGLARALSFFFFLRC